MREGGRGRRATCYLQTLRYKQAIADFKKLLTLEPTNQLVRMQLDSTQKIMRKIEFEKVRLVLAVYMRFARHAPCRSLERLTCRRSRWKKRRTQ